MDEIKRIKQLAGIATEGEVVNLAQRQETKKKDTLDTLKRETLDLIKHREHLQAALVQTLVAEIKLRLKRALMMYPEEFEGLSEEEALRSYVSDPSFIDEHIGEILDAVKDHVIMSLN